MKLTVVGCGDAFGTGGRRNTCFHVASQTSTFLIDCGASSMIGLFALDLSPDDIDTIWITHLHGDHFGGLAWFLIHAQHVANRTRPLTIIGPEGLEQRFITATEALFPGATRFERQFEIRFEVWQPATPLTVNGVTATPYEVLHASGAPPYALRFALEGKTVSFTGDSEWVDNLIPAGKHADLYIMECYHYDIKAKMHLDYQTIASRFDVINAKRILLTHMSAKMLAALDRIDRTKCTPAEDGMVIEL